MAVSLTGTLKNNRADQITTYTGNAALLRIYAGSVPANADAALGGATLLAELTCGSPFAPGASGGVLTANSITGDTSADATGTASFYRLYKADGTTVVSQGTVTATGGGGDMTLATTSIAEGVAVNVTSFTYTEG